MRRSTKRVVASTVALLALVGVIPASAYSDGASDGNDSRSPLDLARVLRTDLKAKMRFELWTSQRFRASRLDISKDRFFMIGFDTDRRRSDPRPFEACVFVFHDGRLRWVATDCGDGFRASGLASKPTGKKIVFTVGMPQLLLYLTDHEWVAFSFWRGSPCARRCADSIPNRPPAFLRDFKAPEITFTLPRLSTQLSASTDFPVPFSVTDPKGSGVKTWTLWGSESGSGAAPMATGSGGGSKAPTISGVEGNSYDFYVNAEDQQGNVSETAEKQIVVPLDDDNLPGYSEAGSVTHEADPGSFGGGLAILHDTTASIQFTGGPARCADIWVIGPGSGTWTIEIRRSLILMATISSTSIPDGARKVLWHDQSCGHQIEVKLTSGTDAAVDAVAVGSF
jgi:hypothetical protein